MLTRVFVGQAVRPIVSECRSIRGQPVGREKCLHQAQSNRPVLYTLGQ